MTKTEEPISYGGQAVMEGVLMRGKKAYAMAVRRPDGEIEMIEKEITSISNRYPILKLPFVRGFVALCSSMALGFGALSKSAEIALDGMVDEPTKPPSRFRSFMNKKFGFPLNIEKWLEEKLGEKFNKVIMTFAMVLAVFMAVGLFMLLPAFLASLIPIAAAFTGAIEGVVRIIIFVSYVFIISRNRDIQRVFQYHGAEHKAINCHEQGRPLLLDNVTVCNRLHKRCGTSFMLVVMVITMILFMIVRIDDIWLRLGSRLLLLPVIAGISYEVSVKWAGKRDNWLVRAIIFPGMCIQKLTTKEPDDKQIEVAVMALERAIEQDMG